MSKVTSHLLVAFLLVAGTMVPRAFAATNYWIGAPVQVASYTNQNYWLDGLLPGEADTVLYTNTYRATVSDLRILMTGPVTNAVVITDFPQNGTRFLGFSNMNWWVSDRFAVGPSVEGRTNFVRFLGGTLSVTNAARTASFVLGNGVGVSTFDMIPGTTLSVDRFYMTNALSYLQGSGQMQLAGNLNIYNGGQIIVANESFTNNAADLRLLNNVNMLGGTTVVTTLENRGVSLFSGAVVRVSGSATVFRASQVYVAQPAGSADAAFWIQDGGMAVLAGLAVGSNATQFGSTTTTGSGLAVVTNGGTLQANRISIGTNGMGTLSVVGATLQFTTNTPQVSLKTTGTFTFASSTMAFQGVTNANFFSSQVTNITYSGDNTLSLRTATNAMLGSYTFRTNNGQAFAFLDLQGGVFRSTNLLVGSGGKITGSGLVASLHVTNAGTIAPGQSPGTLTFASNLTLDAASVLNLELGGTNALDFDRLLASGALSLGGTLNVTLINGYIPNAGDTVDVLDWGSIFGTFSTVNLPSAEWSAANLYTDGTLTYAAIPEPHAGMALLAALAALAASRARRRAA